MFRYGKTGWTSASTAIASGIAASVIDACMDNSAMPGSRPIPEDVFGIMEQSAGCVHNVSSYDNDYPNYHVGWGKVSMARAVFMARYGSITHHTAASNPYSGYMEEDTVYTWPAPQGWTSWYAIPCRLWHVVDTGSAGGTKACWGHHRFPTTGTMRLGENQEIFYGSCDSAAACGYKWCDPSPSYYRGAPSCTLNTFTYLVGKVTDPPGLVITEYVPVDPEDVVFSYSVLTCPGYGGVDEGFGGHSGIASQRPILDTYPQPFNPETRLRFVVPTDGPVKIAIYDVLGREIRTLVDEDMMSSGIYFYTWDGKDKHGIGCGTGIYFCRLTVKGVSVARKLVLIK